MALDSRQRASWAVFCPEQFCSEFSPPSFQIHKLQSENLQIRQQAGPVHPAAPAPSERPEHGHVPSAAPGAHRRDRHAFSMYEPGASSLKPFGQPPVDDLVSRLQPFHPGVSVRESGPCQSL